MLLRDPVRSNRLCDLGGTWIRPAEVKTVVRAYYKGNHYKKRKEALAVVEPHTPAADADGSGW